MRDLYASQFVLTAANAFVEARQRIADWATIRYEAIGRQDASQDIALAPAETDQIEWTNYGDDATAPRAWTLTFRHRDADDASLAWRTVAQLSEVAGTVRFTIRVSQESLEARIAPALNVPGRPRIVRDLANDLGGVADGRQLSSRPTSARSDDVPALVDLLLNPARRLPVVVTSVAEETARPATDPAEIASQLAGLAHVFAVAVAPATYELTGRVGRTLSVFDGAIRIYWPGLTMDADPYVHRLWLGPTVEQIDRRVVSRDGRNAGFARHLLTLIAGIAALRVSADPVVRHLRRDAEARLRAIEHAELRRAIERTSIPPEFMEDFDRQARLIKQQGGRIDELEFEKELLEEEKERLERERDAIAGSFAVYQAAVRTERGVEPDGLPSAPTSIREALQLVAANHPESLVVLPEAYDSAAETRYPHIERAATALAAIGAVADGWQAGTLGKSFDAAFAEAGFELRNTGEVTQGRFAKDYGRTYEGRRVLLGPHLALGDGGSTDTIFRVYWYLDETKRCFVLGHAGRHLPASTS